MSIEDFKKKRTLVQKHIDAEQLGQVLEFVKIDETTIDLIKHQKGGDNTKIINLVHRKGCRGAC